MVTSALIGELNFNLYQFFSRNSQTSYSLGSEPKVILHTSYLPLSVLSYNCVLVKTRGSRCRPLSAFFSAFQSACPTPFVQLRRERGRSAAPSHHHPSAEQAHAETSPAYRHECKAGGFSRSMSGVSAHAPAVSLYAGQQSVFSRLRFFAVQLFQFFIQGACSFLNNGQNKSDQLFTVDRRSLLAGLFSIYLYQCNVLFHDISCKLNNACRNHCYQLNIVLILTCRLIYHLLLSFSFFQPSKDVHFFYLLCLKRRSIKTNFSL